MQLWGRLSPVSCPHRLIYPLFFAGAAFLSLLVLRFLPYWAGLGSAMLVFGLAAVLSTRLRTRTG